MIRICKEHEDWLEEQLQKGVISTETLLLLHGEQIEFLQHERLVHLIVTLFTGGMLVVFFVLSFLLESLLVLILQVIFAGLFFAYLIHYARLENCVQKWYGIYRQLWERTYGT
ncbi:hypothetical protein J0B03_03240 [Alkalibacter rhizosphaerae]|uniref:Uncharacterized protein n=1 Tax=Alkalibacter rhizosphaerae TaxID=2815577 RepID=A0A975AI49_9FIRM|nr:hypothetical protein [Alkalibacter rhizosphaerae]QSX09097.1 hypothetical protein J0B03_03240 [Alkalibacter rhizosphaerae]